MERGAEKCSEYSEGCNTNNQTIAEMNLQDSHEWEEAVWESTAVGNVGTSRRSRGGWESGCRLGVWGSRSDGGSNEEGERNASREWIARTKTQRRRERDE